jgi:hypothetical protein
MTKLFENWMTEGLIDFEYKKYQQLAYLQATNAEFKGMGIYPVLIDIIQHQRFIREIHSGLLELSNLFYKDLESIDFQQAKLYYISFKRSGEFMEEVDKITGFALSKFTGQIEQGQVIAELVEDQLEFDPVAIIPIYNREGYDLLSQERSSTIHAFQYKVNLIQYAGDRFRNISIWLIGVFKTTILHMLEKIKLELTNEIKKLSNLATFRLHSRQPFPIEETLLPIGKKLLLKTVSAQAHKSTF